MTGVDSRENERIALGDSKCNQFLQGGLFHRGAEKQGYSYKRKYNPGRVFLKGGATPPHTPVAQMVKNLLAVWETWVQSLDWEDP